MKKAYLLILLLVAFKIHSTAQSPAARYTPVPAVTYDTCNILQQLQGEWMYTNGADTIRIYLRCHRDSNASFKNVSDNLYGWHQYKSGATIIESNYDNRFMSLSYNGDYDDTNQRSISLKLKSCSPLCDTLLGNIFDYLQNKELHVVTAVLNVGRTTITWTQDHREGFGFRTNATGMTLPRQFVLVKQ